VTDETGQAALAFRFPFTDGVTGILLNASTYQFAGYVRGGTEAAITKEVTVSGPGSLTPVVIHSKPELVAAGPCAPQMISRETGRGG